MTDESDSVMVSARCFLDIENYFQEALESSSGLDILLANKLDSYLFKNEKTTLLINIFLFHMRASFFFSFTPSIS